MQISSLTLHLGRSAFRNLNLPRCRFRSWGCTIPKRNRREELTYIETPCTSPACRHGHTGDSDPYLACSAVKGRDERAHGLALDRLRSLGDESNQEVLSGPRDCSNPVHNTVFSKC